MAIDNRNKDEEKLFVSYNYPHSLMMHITSIFKERNLQGPEHLLDEGFLDLYEEEYLEFANEVVELEEAINRGIIKEFIEKENASEWQKRVFISISIAKMIPTVREYEAVELLETLMFLFHWEMEFEIRRKWEAPDNEKAWYHQFRKPGDPGYDNFERKAKEYLAYQLREKKEAERKRAIRKGRNRRNAVPNKTVEVPKKSSPLKSAVIRQSQNKPIEKTQTIQSQKAEKSKKHTIVGQTTEGDTRVLLIEELSDEEYKRELSMIRLKYENLMSLSLRKNIKKAKRGEAAAQYQIGEFYAEPNTKHTDYREAVKWYGFAARQGNSRAKFEMGRIFDSEKIEGREMKPYGIRYFKELADDNYPTAQYILGMKYYMGDGLEKDLEKGVHWLLKAAYQGIVEAQVQLGDIYMLSDAREAKKWYEKASAMGDLTAKQKLRQI